MKTVFMLAGALSMGTLFALGLRSAWEGLSFRGRPLKDIVTREEDRDDLGPPRGY